MSEEVSHEYGRCKVTTGGLALGGAMYDRTTQDVGNIIGLEHLNVGTPDLELAALFYISGLGFTRDPFVDFGGLNLWVNVGSQQIHIPRRREAQVVPGVVGVVMPDVDLLSQRLHIFDERFRDRFDGSKYGWGVEGDSILVTCPWGNYIRVHSASEAHNGLQYGIAYVEFYVQPGTAHKIARFYREIFDVPTEVRHNNEFTTAIIGIGRGQEFRFCESQSSIPEYDGHHVAIYLTNFSRPHGLLVHRGLVIQESNDHEYRFQDIVDLDSGEVLMTLEHEVRSTYHPMYGRPLVNRNEFNSFFETNLFANYDVALDSMVGVHRSGQG